MATSRKPKLMRNVTRGADDVQGNAKKTKNTVKKTAATRSSKDDTAGNRKVIRKPAANRLSKSQ